VCAGSDSGKQNAGRLTWIRIAARINGTKIIVDDDEEDEVVVTRVTLCDEEQILPARVSPQMAPAMTASLPGSAQE
jgi:hypothetical protein